MSSFLLDSDGNRLYLTQDERSAFIDACKKLPKPKARTYCEMLALTGCRESEPLEVCPYHISLDEKVVIFRTLKKRRQDHYRRVPLQDSHLDTLSLVHGIRDIQRREGHPGRDEPLWAFTRMTGWRYVNKVMIDAGIPAGPHRSPKGLRHAFGVNAVLSGIPITTLQKWMGHSKLETTAEYLNIIGPEERELASRMWTTTV